MKTIIKRIDANNIDIRMIQKAGDILKRGGLVAFPTETVYGLGANALDEEAARKTYAAKGRPSDNPLIVHIADVQALEEIAVNIPIEVEELAYHFWPGLGFVFEGTISEAIELSPYKKLEDAYLWFTGEEKTDYE